MTRVGIAILGCEQSVAMYMPMFRYLDNGEFIAAVDIAKKKAEKARDVYGAKRAYTSIDEMLLDAEIDGVIVATPHYLHAEHVVKIAEAGKHVLCEKPMARTIDECDRIIDACDRNGVILMPAHMKRFNWCFQLATEMIQDGTLGDVAQVRTQWDTYAQGTDAPYMKHRTLGLACLGFGSHTIDLSRWWLGEVETVSAEVSIGWKGREVDDQSVMTLRHIGGQVSVHSVSLVFHKPLLEEYTIFGTEATLQMRVEGLWSYTSHLPFDMKLYRRERMVEDVTPKILDNIDDTLTRTNHFLKEMEHFCDCIINGKTPMITGEDGRKATEISNAGYLSSWKKRKVVLPLPESPDLETFFNELAGLEK